MKLFELQFFLEESATTSVLCLQRGSLREEAAAAGEVATSLL